MTVALWPGDVRDDAGVVHFQKARDRHLGDERHRFARLDLIGRRRQLDLIGHAVNQPAHQLPPVGFVRHVFDGDLRVHLPRPRVVDGKRERLAAAVALVGERDRIRGRSRRRRVSSAVAPGLICRIGFTLMTGGRVPQRFTDPCSVFSICVTACACAGARRRHLRRARSCPAAWIEHDRQGVGHRRARIAAFGKRSRGRRSSAARRRVDRRSRQSCAAGRR